MHHQQQYMDMIFIVFVWFMNVCTLLPGAKTCPIWVTYSAHTNCTVTNALSTGSPAFRWQEAALAMETAVWAGVLQVKDKHTHTVHTQCHAIHGRGSDLEIYGAKKNQKRTEAQNSSLFTQTITFNHLESTHTHFHSTLWSPQLFK